MTESDDFETGHPAGAGSEPSPQSPVAAAVPPGTAVAAGGLAFLVMTAVLLQSRRLAGGIPATLSPLAGVLLAVLMATCTLAACWFLRRAGASAGERPPRGEAASSAFLLTLLLSSGLPLVTGLSLLPAGATWGLSVVLLLSLGTGCAAVLFPAGTARSSRIFRGLNAAAPDDSTPRKSITQGAVAGQKPGLPEAGPREVPPLPEIAHSLSDGGCDSLDGECAEAEDGPHVDWDMPEDSESGRVIQWTRRTQDEGGTESIAGSLKTVFPPGQRTHVVHLAFSPPLVTAPSIECEVISDVELRCRVAATMPWGARIELRRTAADAESGTDLPLELEYFATSACLRAA